MHDYCFFPNLYTEGLDVVFRGYTPEQTDRVGRLKIHNTHTSSYRQYAVRWRYITASNNPQIWVVQDPVTGEIIGIWQADDPPEIETDNPFKIIPIQHYDKNGRPFGTTNYVEIPSFLDEFRKTLDVGIEEIRKRYKLKEKSTRPKNLSANIKFAILKKR